MRHQPFLVLLFALIFIPGVSISPSPAWAKKPSKDIYFADTKNMPAVVFSHNLHVGKGLKCNQCHDGLFLKEKGSTDIKNALTMKSMNEGKYCGKCHDGVSEFKVGRSCFKCHIKRK